MSATPLECERILLVSPDIASTREAAAAAAANDPVAVVSEEGDPDVEEYAETVGDIVAGVVALNVGESCGPEIVRVTDDKLLIRGASPVVQAVLAERALRQGSDPTRGGKIRRWLTRSQALSRVARLEQSDAAYNLSGPFMEELISTVSRHGEPIAATPLEIATIAGEVTRRAIREDVRREAAENLAA